MEKSEIEAKYIFFKEQLESLKKSKEQDEAEYKEHMRQLKEEQSTEMEDYRFQKDDFEEKL